MSLKALARAALSQKCPTVPTLGTGTVGHQRRTIADKVTAETNGTFGTLGTAGTLGTGKPVLSPIDDPGAMLACDYEERATILEYDAGLPRAWAEMFARQLVTDSPGDFSPTRWQAAIDGALTFADQWAVEAFWQGWEAEEVFGLHPVAPAARYDCRGLAWLLGDGARVTAIDNKGADMTGRTGGRQRFYRRRA